ncbi:MAG: uracil-DNA glycosylase [Oscillospiraceae bacterium]|nr:uracil-DNA glycosylase [Oscillospiraceae bacterium]
MYTNWESLQKDCMNCRKCALAETRTNLVFGVGVPDAEIVFIGEGPGEQEDLRGEPFVGRGGQLLDKYLDAIGLDRKTNIYIGNMVKCRPPQNRDPKPEEQEACIGWLREQIRLIRPKIIVCLGRISAQRLIDPAFRVTKQHGEFIEKNGTWMMGTFHPAALLRNPRQKPDALEDFLRLRDKIREVCTHTVLTDDN